MPTARRRRASRPAQQEHLSTKRVSRQFFTSGEPEEEEVTQDSDVHVFVTDPAYVRINHGMTVNMGNYQSLRVDVSVSVPCYVEDIAPTRERISNYVAETLEQEVGMYQGGEG